MIMLERYKDNAFIFDHTPDGDFVVVYPTKADPHFMFYLKTEDGSLYELGLPNETRQEVMAQIINMNLDNYWVDTTDWANQVYGS